MISVWILGDQLLTNHPALRAAVDEVGRDQVRVVLVESQARLTRQPYQRKKLVLLLSAMRHYASWLQKQGYAVEQVQAMQVLDGLRQHMSRWQPAALFCMSTSEYAGRQFQNQLSSRLGLPVIILPNTQFLTAQFNPYPQSQAERRYVLENFYRAMRHHFGFLLEPDGTPIGKHWNYDAENRQPLPKGALPPEPPGFPTAEITRQVMQEVAALPGGIGSVAGFDLAMGDRCNRTSPASVLQTGSLADQQGV